MERGESSFALGSKKENTTFLQIGLAVALWEAAGWLFRRALFVQRAQEMGSGLLMGHRHDHAFLEKENDMFRDLENKIYKPVYL